MPQTLAQLRLAHLGHRSWCYTWAVGTETRVAPIATARYKVQFTADAEIYEQLRLAQDMLRHHIPDGDVGRIIGRGLAALLRELARQKFAATERPRMSKQEAGEARRARAAADERAAPERHIPAAVKREVWLRDGGRCAFVASNGRRCGKRDVLEFHHVVPYAMSGEAAVPNIQLRCPAHHPCGRSD